MLAPKCEKYEEDTITESLWHIFALHIIRPRDLVLWPIFPQIEFHDPELVVNMYAYTEVHRHFRYWNMKP